MIVSMENSITIESTSDGTRLTFSDFAGESFTALIEGAFFFGRVIVSTCLSGPPSHLLEEIARLR